MVTASAFASLPEVESRHAPIVSFRAGKCVVDGPLVSPDTRKGTLQLIDGEDGLLRVQWLERPPRGIEDDLIIIGDAYLEPVSQCATGRVFVLRFTSSDKKVLFWLQEPDASNDKELIATFNRHAGGTPPTNEAGPALSGPRRPADSPAALPPGDGAAAAASAGSQQQQAEQLRQLLRSFAESSSTRRGDSGTPGGRHATVPLSQVLSAEAAKALCQDPEAIAELTELMPETLRSEGEAREALRCPQLAQALSGLSQAIYTDAAPLLASVGASVAASTTLAADPMEAFAEALESRFKQQANAAVADPPESAVPEATPAQGASSENVAEDDEDPPKA